MSFHLESGAPASLDPAFNRSLREPVRQSLQADSPYRRLLADDLADTVACRRAASALANQALDAEIRAMWDQVSAAYPAADPSLRTVLAWKQYCKVPGALSSLALRSQTWSSISHQLDGFRRLARARKER